MYPVDVSSCCRITKSQLFSFSPRHCFKAWKKSSGLESVLVRGNSRGAWWVAMESPRSISILGPSFTRKKARSNQCMVYLPTLTPLKYTIYPVLKVNYTIHWVFGERNPKKNSIRFFCWAQHFKSKAKGAINRAAVQWNFHPCQRSSAELRPAVIYLFSEDVWEEFSNNRLNIYPGSQTTTFYRLVYEPPHLYSKALSSPFARMVVDCQGT